MHTRARALRYMERVIKNAVFVNAAFLTRVLYFSAVISTQGAELLDWQRCSLIFPTAWRPAAPLETDLRPVMRLQFPLSLQSLQVHLLL